MAGAWEAPGGRGGGEGEGGGGGSQRSQVFLHFFAPSALAQKVADTAFIRHQRVPKPLMSLSSHAGRERNWSFGCWQTYFFFLVQRESFHLPGAEDEPKMAKLASVNSRQSSRPFALLGSPAFQLVYDTGVLDGLHTHAPSDAASVPPIHTP